MAPKSVLPGSARREVPRIQPGKSVIPSSGHRAQDATSGLVVRACAAFPNKPSTSARPVRSVQGLLEGGWF